MNKLIFFIISLTLVSCQKYDGPFNGVTSPSVAGAWKFTDYYVTKVSEISPTDVIPNDTICVNSFSSQSVVSGGKLVLMKQNYNTTTEDRRFIKNQTIWDFDGPTGSTYFPLLINRTNIDCYVKFPNYMEREYTKMSISNNKGYVTNYNFFTSAVGANYSNKLTLTSPVISTDLCLSNGSRQKAIDVVVTLIFTRFD